ncbi:MAG TPA: nucleotidyltransferase domain-containing protein [Trinickia sp.]|uniref:nucleotidyltransferase family protein n=1 Tax=Trinickia sp. TaxID=2571163 RepID=UPI002BC3E5B8|nr:nucleotidyltransferase domain-containing protein [Trinickia sp.]HTI17398.1 nucleotidyltransferase domain-containing protein [Trinickia sp.]
MKPSEVLSRHRAEIRRIVASNRATNPRVFGSVTRGEDRDGSDLDTLVDPTLDTSLLDTGIIQAALARLLGINVDVLTPKALPVSCRATVINEAVSV